MNNLRGDPISYALPGPRHSADTVKEMVQKNGNAPPSRILPAVTPINGRRTVQRVDSQTQSKPNSAPPQPHVPGATGRLMSGSGACRSSRPPILSAALSKLSCLDSVSGGACVREGCSSRTEEEAKGVRPPQSCCCCWLCTARTRQAPRTTNPCRAYSLLAPQF